MVFQDGESFWLAEGFHRLAAYQAAGIEEAPCDVRSGGLRDAILHSASANTAHGVRRTNADKRRAVMMLLDDEEWSNWSDREISRQCAVHHETVASTRSSYLAKSPDSPRLAERNGTVYPMNPRQKPADLEPSLPVAEEAQSAPEPPAASNVVSLAPRLTPLLSPASIATGH